MVVVKGIGGNYATLNIFVTWNVFLFFDFPIRLFVKYGIQS